MVFEVNYEEQAGLNYAELRGGTPPAADALINDCNQARSGRCAVRTTTKIQDDYFSFGAYRVESSSINFPATRYSEGETYRYKVSMRIAEDWAFDTTRHSNLVWQFKRFNNNPDAFLVIKGGDLVLRVDTLNQPLLIKMPKEEWVDVVMEVTWGFTKPGRFVAWVDGCKACDPNKKFTWLGPNMRTAEPRATYLKWGIYRPGSREDLAPVPSRTMWHDNIVVEKLN